MNGLLGGVLRNGNLNLDNSSTTRETLRNGTLPSNKQKCNSVSDYSNFTFNTLRKSKPIIEERTDLVFDYIHTVLN